MVDDSIIAIVLGIIVTNIGAVMLWIRAELKKIEDKDAVKVVVAKLNESNSQGDSLASIAKLIIGDVITSASTIPTLEPYVAKMKLIHADAVSVWNNPDGSDEQMAALVKAANDIYSIVKNALPMKVV